jgi:branched-chain amino acid transport system ATP-binding protein
VSRDPMPPALRCRNLEVARDGLPCLRNLSLDARAGKTTVLLGANGAGKTTLMEAISGVIEISSGSVQLFGEEIGDLRPVARARRGMAAVEQGRTVFKAMTTLDNLSIVGDTAAIERALNYFPELRGRLRIKAGLLSGGEQQMLALARALVTRPKVLLIDEMSLGLAPLVVKRLLPLIRDLAREEQIAMLIVEQFALLALEVADHAYVVRKGEVTFDGEPTDLLNSPALLEAAYFGTTERPTD